ncbi:hypothetical protein GE061_014865 [Apolygus lucorum]|uniref:Uncharacterized protein n=1 Tax=Apolygus lucorum TaxID=248454 RepID=A0A8S9XJD3_APOLU|nr:hypothetical protein GE061_014865 [Apolygus lucorum]
MSFQVHFPFLADVSRKTKVTEGGKHDEGYEGSAGWTDGLPQSQQSIFSSQRSVDWAIPHYHLLLNFTLVRTSPLAVEETPPLTKKPSRFLDLEYFHLEGNESCPPRMTRILG